MIKSGDAAEVTLVVGDHDTAIAHGSGDVPVLATPRVLALAEQAAVAALGEDLDQGQTSVGVHVELHHVKATHLGRAVTAHAEVTAIEGRTITFEFRVVEDDEVVAHGNHRRVVVDRDRFLP
ncbi:MAG: hotdog domain-containing protein [Acidimicrobiia bacterium]|nr:hotdog domain-containing protein [Acidimicrobiia bacterium]